MYYLRKAIRNEDETYDTCPGTLAVILLGRNSVARNDKCLISGVEVLQPGDTVIYKGSDPGVCVPDLNNVSEHVDWRLSFWLYDQHSL